MQQSVTLKIDENTALKMKDFYKDFFIENTGMYVFFAAEVDSTKITVYQSKNGYKALFQGNNSLLEAKIWDQNAEINVAKEKVKSEWKDLSSQIGSDEVGVGDFFGPLIVVASYVDESIIPFLKELGVDDSKKVTDQKILEIVPKIITKVKYCRLTCTPEKYNEMYKKGYNINSLKAILHNEALQNVRSQIHSLNMKCYVDQFCSTSNYYSYLEGKYDAIYNNIVFETKGESHYPSVAVSSMIARYCFLKYYEDLNNEFNLEFPKGASLKVDEFAIKFTQIVGIDNLYKYVKCNFTNYRKLIDSIKK